MWPLIIRLLLVVHTRLISAKAWLWNLDPMFLIGYTVIMFFGLTIYVMVRLWEEWNPLLRVIAVGGVLGLVALGLVVRAEVADVYFKAEFLADYSVAFGLFVFTFFAVEQFLDVSRNDTIFRHYIPSVRRELIQNCISLAKTFIAVRKAMWEGCESLPEGRSPTVEYRTASWASFRDSGQFATLPTERHADFRNVSAALLSIDNELVASGLVPAAGKPRDTELVDWADDFPSDIWRSYELLEEARFLLNNLQLYRIPKAMVGSAATKVIHYPGTQAEKEFVDAYKKTAAFCHVARVALVFTCFVLRQMSGVITSRGRASRAPTAHVDPCQELAKLQIGGIVSNGT